MQAWNWKNMVDSMTKNFETSTRLIKQYTFINYSKSKSLITKCKHDIKRTLLHWVSEALMTSTRLITQCTSITYSKFKSLTTWEVKCKSTHHKYATRIHAFLASTPMHWDKHALQVHNSYTCLYTTSPICRDREQASVDFVQGNL